MLTGNTAAQLDAEGENVAPGLQDDLCFPRIMPVERNTRVEIAITRMSDVGNAQAILGTNGGHPAQGLRQFGAWHAAIDDITVRGETRHGPKRCTPAQPHTRGSCGSLSCLNGYDIVLSAKRRDEFPAAWHVLLKTVEFNNQSRASVGWIAHMHRLIHRLHNRLVQQFQRRR